MKQASGPQTGRGALARLAREMFYAGCHEMLLVGFEFLSGVRHFNVPGPETLRGGVLIAANHQSYLDPPLVGIALSVPINYLGRESLFRFPVFAQVLSAVGVKRYGQGRVDRAGLKEAIRILRSGDTLLVFPEGTRTRDGAIAPFRHGVGSLAVRCGVPVLPVCIAGAYECWPRSRLLPRFGRIAVAYGELIPAKGRHPDDVAAETEASVREMKRRLDAYLGR